MHYYQHHLGDYSKDTCDLSVIQHGAYRLLLDYYYATERPLPADQGALCRICRAMSKVERDAVKEVCGKFFRQEGSVLLHKRVEQEIGSYRSTCDLNRSNGKKGGRPRKAPLPENRPVSPPVMREETGCDPGEKPNHDPSSSNHESMNQDPETRSHDPSASSSSPFPPSGVQGGGGKGFASRERGNEDEGEPEAAPSDSRHAGIVRGWCARHEAVHGAAYVTQGGRDGSALKRLLTSAPDLTVQAFLSRAEAAWQRVRQDRFASRCRQAATIHGLCHAWNDVGLELNAPPVGQGGGGQSGREARGQRPEEISADESWAKVRKL